MKKITSAFLSVLLLLSVLSAAYGTEEFVFDDYGYIQEIGILNDQAREITESSGYIASCAITDSVPGTNGNEQAQRLFEEKFGTGEGIMLLDCVDTQNCYIYFSKNLYENLTEADAQTLFEAYDSQTDYDSAVSAFLDAAGLLLDSVPAGGIAETAQSENVIPESRSYSRVVDLADVLSEADHSKLNSLADSISEQYKCDVAAAFVESTDGKDIQAFADDFYDYNGYGYGDSDDGIMLVIAVGDREYAITTHGYGVHAVTDRALDYLEKSFIDDLSANNWANAGVDFISASGEILYNAAYERQSGAETEAAKLNPIELIPINIVIGLAIGFFVVAIMKGKHRSVIKKTEASGYLRDGSFKLTYSNDRFIHSQVNRVKKPEPQRSSDFSGGTTTHISSSGRTHGGESGKF